METTEWESLKPITLEAMERAGASPLCDDYKRFADLAVTLGYGCRGEIPAIIAMSWAKTAFLINKGFLREKVKPKVDLSKLHIEDEDEGEVKCLYYGSQRLISFWDTGNVFAIFGLEKENVPFPLDSEGRIKVL